VEAVMMTMMMMMMLMLLMRMVRMLMARCSLRALLTYVIAD